MVSCMQLALLCASISACLALRPALPCDKDVCKLPKCFCGGFQIPGGLKAKDIPQFVLLTFDDAINTNTLNTVKDYLKRKPVNTDNIKATFFVSHMWTLYSDVQDLYADGHEIASHSITHESLKNERLSVWAKEIKGQALMLEKWAQIKKNHIKGMRAPHLDIGGDTMFSMLKRFKFAYDSSISSIEPSWPYTLEYQMPGECVVPPCPTKSHPGVWEIPLNQFNGSDGLRCAMADACTYPANDTDGILKVWKANFERFYKSGHRAPFPLMVHHSFILRDSHIQDAFGQFIDNLARNPDVYFVTAQELLRWMRNPKTLAEMGKNYFNRRYPERRRCNRAIRFCPRPRNKGETPIPFKTCLKCPEYYPWLGNLNGDRPTSTRY